LQESHTEGLLIAWMEILFLELGCHYFWPGLASPSYEHPAYSGSLCFVSQKNCDVAEVLFLGLNFATW